MKIKLIRLGALFVIAIALAAFAYHNGTFQFIATVVG